MYIYIYIYIGPTWDLHHLRKLLLPTCKNWWSHLGVYQNLLLSMLVGSSHPFTNYFDVHQGYKVLTQSHFCLASSGQSGGRQSFGFRITVARAGGSTVPFCRSSRFWTDAGHIYIYIYIYTCVQYISISYPVLSHSMKYWLNAGFLYWSMN